MDIPVDQLNHAKQKQRNLIALPESTSDTFRVDAWTDGRLSIR